MINQRQQNRSISANQDKSFYQVCDKQFGQKYAVTHLQIIYYGRDLLYFDRMGNAPAKYKVILMTSLTEIWKCDRKIKDGWKNKHRKCHFYATWNSLA